VPPTRSQPAALNAQVARSATLVAVFFGLDKALGVVRDAVIGRAFGASAALDAYYAAFELPDALFNVVAGLAMATALIPVLSVYTEREDREGTWALVSTVINWALILVIGVSTISAVYAPQIIDAIAPGFEAARAELAVRLMRLVLVQTTLSSVSGIVMSALQAHRHFLLPAAAPLAYTLGRILGTLLLAPQWGVFGLAVGGLAGTLGHFLIQVPGLLRYGARWTPRLRHPEFNTVLRLMGPRVLGLAVTYLNFVLPTFLGSRLAVGAIASYEYGWRLMQFPETIIGTALGLTVFPTLSQRANAGDREGLRRTAAWALRLVLALAVPAAVMLITLGRPLTALFFQRGAFDAATTERVYRGLQAFSLGLVAHSVLEVTSRLFYAQRDMWTPLWAAAVGLVANGILGTIWLASLAHVGLALANSVGALIQVAILLSVAHRRLGSLEEGGLGLALGRTVLVTSIMGGAVLGFQRLVPGAGLLLSAVGGLSVAGIAFVVAVAALGSRELRELPRMVLNR
jgi:putative peptidoglycan lipid II flippase